MWDWLLARIWKTLACAASFPRTSKEVCNYVVSKTWVCKVIISQGAGHSNSKRHREPRNYQQQPPVMPNRWGKWFRTTGFWSSRALVVDPAPSTCKVRISQGVGHSNSKRHRLITNNLTKKVHRCVLLVRFFVVNKHKQKNNTTKKKQKDQVPSPESLPSSSSSSSFSSSCTHSHPVDGVHEEEKKGGRDSGRRQCARFSSQALFAKKTIAFQWFWET